MVIFHSYIKLPEGIPPDVFHCPLCVRGCCGATLASCTSVGITEIVAILHGTLLWLGAPSINGLVEGKNYRKTLYLMVKTMVSGVSG